MSAAEMELLIWVRGPGLAIACALFLFGLMVRLAEIFLLERGLDRSMPRLYRRPALARVVWRRWQALREYPYRSPVTYLGGLLFHFGLVVILLLYAPHIQLLRQLLGVGGWSGVSAPVVDGVVLITMLSLAGLLIARLVDPVKRFLTTFDDILAWLLTWLPLMTGYMAYHHLLLPYTLMLALHLLSAELLLALLPFTSLVHGITVWWVRRVNADRMTHRGAWS